MVAYYDLENLAEKFHNCSIEDHYNKRLKKGIWKITILINIILKTFVQI